MIQDVAIQARADLPDHPDLSNIAARAAGLAEGARAAATRKAYQSDWRHFEAWCAGHDRTALPADPMTVGLYIAQHADGLSVATLTRRVSAIATAHRMANHPMDTRHPAIRDVMRGLRREKGVSQDHAEALTVPLLRQLLATCGDRLLDQRDRALLLVGFGAALRRSELVALDVADIAVVPEGLRVTIRRSKSDQDGEGAVLAIGRTGRETCPVAAYTGWLAASMRAGFATSAAQAGIEERLIMRQTRHRSVATVRRYIRDGELFDRNLAAEVGL